jgi:hypothetical protein
MRSAVLAGAIIATGLVHASSALPQTVAEASFPPVLNSYMTKYVRLTPAERNALLANRPVIKLLDSDPDQEVAIFGAVWIDALPEVYVRLVSDIEHFERGGAFRTTKRISDPPQLADFASLTLPDEDIAALKTCQVGDCDIKLSQEPLERLRHSIDWTKPTARADAVALFRRLIHEYVMGYVEGGNDRLAVYRDSARPTFVAAEFKSMIDRMPELGEQLPELKAYLLEYPRVTLPGGTAFLYWQDVQFGLKPMIRVNHLVIDDRPGVKAVVSKMIYASHYFWTALDLRVIVPDPSRGRGFWLVSVARSRSDGLSGFVGRLIRGKVHNEAKKGMDAALRATKARLEHEHNVAASFVARSRADRMRESHGRSLERTAGGRYPGAGTAGESPTLAADSLLHRSAHRRQLATSGRHPTVEIEIPNH